MLEVRHALQPAEEQLHLPTMLIQQRHLARRQIKPVRQQQNVTDLVGAIRRPHRHATQRRQRHALIAALAQRHRLLRDNAGRLVGGRKRASFKHLDGGTLTQANQEVALGFPDICEQLVSLKSTIHDVEAAGREVLAEIGEHLVEDANVASADEVVFGVCNWRELRESGYHWPQPWRAVNQKIEASASWDYVKVAGPKGPDTIGY